MESTSVSIRVELIDSISYIPKNYFPIGINSVQGKPIIIYSDENLNRICVKTSIDEFVENAPQKILETLVVKKLIGEKLFIENLKGTISLEMDSNISQKVCGKLRIHEYVFNINKIIPEEYKKEYCLFYGGELFLHTKDLDEFNKKKSESYIVFTEYYPK